MKVFYLLIVASPQIMGQKIFKTNGIQFAHIKNTAHVSNKELRCHKLWPTLL